MEISEASGQENATTKEALEVRRDLAAEKGASFAQSLQYNITSIRCSRTDSPSTHERTEVKQQQWFRNNITTNERQIARTGGDTSTMGGE